MIMLSIDVWQIHTCKVAACCVAFDPKFKQRSNTVSTICLKIVHLWSQIQHSQLLLLMMMGNCYLPVSKYN